MSVPALSTQPSPYSYDSALRNALKVNWRIEDIIGGNQRLDFTRRFMPETLSRVNDLPFLNSYEKLKLSQIRGNSYLHIFGLVGEFVVPTVLEQVRRLDQQDRVAVRSLLHFAEEESKHIRLFHRFAEAFERDFGSRCDVVGPAHEIVEAVLQHHPLGVILMILYLEWMTQRHYLESVRDTSSESLEVQFCNLLRYHWLEEAQHTTLDTLMAKNLAQSLSPAELAVGIADFFKLIELLDTHLMDQVQLDIENLSRAISRPLIDAEQETLRTLQARSYRWTFIGSGLVNNNFVKTFSEISPEHRSQLLDVARAHCY